MMFWTGGQWMGGGGWVLMMLMWLLFVVGIIVVLRTGTSGGERGCERETPLDILKKRYARGEIDRTEYEQKRQDIEAR